MKRTAALLVLIGLVCAHAAYAEEEKTPPPAAAPAEQIDVRKIKAGDDFITLNFTNVDINALVKVMSELTRRNFILDERVTGKITIMTPTRISPEEAYQVFLSALEIKGFTAVEDGRIVRIIPTTSARQSGLKVVEDGDMRGQGFVTKLVRMNFVNPQDIVRTITPLMTKDGNLIAYPATNSLIITDAVYNIKKIESLIQAMDVAAPEGRGKINVYSLKHANAEEIAKLMSALVSRMPAHTPGAAAQPAGPSTILEGAVTITADKATNTLIIVGSRGDFETVKDVLDKIDIRRRQVYVEAAIIEMSLSKMQNLGFEFLAVPQQIQSGPGAPTTGFGGTNFGNVGNLIANGPLGLVPMQGLAVGAIKGTFTYKGTEYLNVGALLHALQRDGDVNVLSTPNILTMDNQKAEIMVGQNVPFLTGQTQNATTGTGTLFNTIERKDVGIKLSLTPQISSDDNVRLEVNQEISDVIATSSSDPAGPTTSKRAASTTVVVKDRQTMVIGGLIRDNVVSTTSKVPFLGDIPILGWLFKSQTTNVEKTNLMIFITPYIIKSDEDAADITRRKGDALEEFRDKHRIPKKDVGGLIESRKPAPRGDESGPVGKDEENIPEKPAEDQTMGTTVPVIPEGTEDGKAETPAPVQGGEQQPAPAEGVR